MRGRESYRERSPTSLRRRSRSRDRSRDRESHRNAQRDYIRRESRDGGSSRSKDKPLNFKEQMRQELIKASKMLSESNVGNLTELMEDKKILGKFNSNEFLCASQPILLLLLLVQLSIHPVTKSM